MFKIFLIAFIYLFVCLCGGCAHGLVLMCWLENSLWESVLSFSPCGLRDPARASRLGGSLLPQGPSHKTQVTLVGWTPAAVSMLVRAPSLLKRIASRGPVFCLGW